MGSQANSPAVDTMKPYSSEAVFMDVRNRVRALSEKSSASEAQLLLTELCELCLTEEYALAVLENGLLDDVALIFRTESNFSVQLLVTTLICLCLKCRRGSVYYPRNVSRTAQFLVQMAKNSSLIVEKLSRHCASSCASKENIIPLAFAAFAWPHLSLQKPPTVSNVEIPPQYPTLGRKYFLAAKKCFSSSGRLPPLPTSEDLGQFHESVEFREDMSSAFTIGSLAEDSLFMLVDAGEPLRGLFKRNHQLGAKIKKLHIQSPRKYRLYPIMMLNIFRSGSMLFNLESFVKTLWESFEIHARNPESHALLAKHSLNALLLIAKNRSAEVIAKESQRELLQSYLIGAFDSGENLSSLAPAWGLAMIAGESVMSRLFLGTLVVKLVEKLQSGAYSNQLAFASWAVSIYYLQGYIELPMLLLQRIAACLLQLQTKTFRHSMLAVIQALEEKLPSNVRLWDDSQVAVGNPPAPGTKPAKKRTKRVKLDEQTVGLCPRFTWGLTSQFYLSMVQSVSRNGVSPWTITPTYDVTTESLSKFTQGPKLEEVKLRLPETQWGTWEEAEYPAPEPRTPSKYSSDATIDWTPQSSRKRNIRGFKEARQPSSVPPRLRLKQKRDAAARVVVESASALIPTFTAMYGPPDNQRHSLTPLLGSSVSGDELLPPAPIAQPEIPSSSVLLFSLTPTQIQNPTTLACDSRSLEPSSALLKAAFLNNELIPSTPGGFL